MMDSAIESVLQGMDLNSQLYRGALEGLSREELSRRCGPESSPVIWIAGHLVSGRYGMAGLAGIKVVGPWQDLFKRYSRIVEPVAYPEVDEIERAWTEISSRLIGRLGQLTDVELDSPSPRKFPVADNTVRAGLAFLLWHESYHIGQMGFLRKWLGYESLVG
jgi:uncharacterized damage-inducible protein DinB